MHYRKEADLLNISQYKITQYLRQTNNIMLKNYNQDKMA